MLEKVLGKMWSNNQAHSCRQVFSEVDILATGDVVCSCIDAADTCPLGNIKQQRIYDIFHGEKYNELRRQILTSKGNRYCPSLKLDCCFKTVPAVDIKAESMPVIETLALETISYCNLKCPECRVPWWVKEKSSRLDKLDLDKIKEVIDDVGDTLKTLRLYNWGEPFLDHHLLDILRFARSAAPQARIFAHTNGTVIPMGWTETIVKEGLFDELFFSIDGTCQETYEKYRVGGDFEKAFNNMTDLQKYRAKYNKPTPNVVWQYILFTWNDSDEELQRVHELAKKYQLTVLWVATHTKGASTKYTYGSEKFERLLGSKEFR